MEIKAGEKLRARKNKEHGKKENGKKRRGLKEEKCEKKRGLDQKDKGGGGRSEGRKAPCVSKNEAKYKVKEIKL